MTTCRHSNWLRAGLLTVMLLTPAITHADGASQNVQSPHWVTVISGSPMRQATGLAIDLRGNPNGSKWAYVADAATQRIVKFGTGGKVLRSWLYGSPRDAGQPAGVAVGGSGNVFVADVANGFVTKYTPSGKLLVRWGPFRVPRSIAVDAHGNVYITEVDVDRILKLSPGGTVLSTWSTETIGSGNTWSGGSFGYPTGIAVDPPDSLYVSTTCTYAASCGVGTPRAPNADMVDWLLEFRSQPPRSGYMKEFWFGLGRKASGQPQEPPGKESEPIVRVDSITSDRYGHLYVAGLLWPRGGNPGMGVIEYTPLGAKTGPWLLSGTKPVGGISVDTKETVYVSQGSRILRLVG